LHRIYRDTRFSNDKRPYKTNWSGSFVRATKFRRGGYYFHIEPGQSFIGGGCYMPLPDELNKIRQEIDYNFDEWKKIVNDKKFKLYFSKVDGIEVLSRPPKGYNDDNPAIEFLKMKSYIVSRPLTDVQLTDKSLAKEAAKTFEAMKPMIDFLNKGMS
jgi:uncharacterized protein (TIGR02453 family)